MAVLAASKIPARYFAPAYLSIVPSVAVAVLTILFFARLHDKAELRLRQTIVTRSNS